MKKNEKAVMLVKNGLVEIESDVGDRIYFLIKSKDKHRVIFDKIKRVWSCDCTFWALKQEECSHIIASRLFWHKTFELKREKLIKWMYENGALKSYKVERAFREVPRHMFVRPGMIEAAYEDTPLPIGYGQTISQPSMIAEMLEELKLEEGMKVLEVGAGSGYVVALLEEIVKRKVYGTEIVKELAEWANKNLKAAGYESRVIWKDGTLGLENHGPFDRILVSAAAPSVPSPLLEQLSEDGLIVIPLGMKTWQQLCVVRKDGSIERKGLCVFVPLKGEYGWKNDL